MSTNRQYFLCLLSENLVELLFVFSECMMSVKSIELLFWTSECIQVFPFEKSVVLVSGVLVQLVSSFVGDLAWAEGTGKLKPCL